MIAVMCTVVFTLATGARQVEQLEGIVLREGTRDMQERLLVDFGNKVPHGHAEAQWVDENACMYMQVPSMQDVQAIARMREEQYQHADEARQTAHLPSKPLSK